MDHLIDGILTVFFSTLLPSMKKDFIELNESVKITSIPGLPDILTLSLGLTLEIAVVIIHFMLQRGGKQPIINNKLGIFRFR